MLVYFEAVVDSISAITGGETTEKMESLLEDKIDRREKF